MPILASIGAGSARGLGLTSGAASLDVDYLVVAGGGSGNYWPGGGAGGGGFRTSYPGGTKLSIKKGAAITVGNGGPNSGNPGVRGSPSSIGDFVADGGGGGGPTNDPSIAASLAGSPTYVADGGSGGGANHQGASSTKPNTTAPYWGLGNTPGNFSPSEGNYGSAPMDVADTTTNYEGSGGGGAGAVGNRASHNSSGGPGGSGAANSITGSSVTYAGGGGGGVYSTGRPGGGGGSGGGGAGGPRGSGGTPGTNGLGGGGGGGSDPTTSAGAGGNGIVYIRVPSADAPGDLAVTPGTNSVTTLPPGDKLCTFSVSGTITF